MSRTRVFVYGSLRQGASNAFRMEGAEFLGPACIAGDLYRVDWYPGVVLGGQNKVIGEVYLVPEEIMPELDAYEGSEYTKKVVKVESGSVCFDAVVWEYNRDISALEIIPSGDWMDIEPA